MARRRKPTEQRIYLRGRIWWAWGYDASGKRWDVSTKQRDERAAERVALRLDREKADQTHSTRPLALEDAISKLIDHLEQVEKRSPVTIEIYLGRAGHLVRVFGSKRNIAALTEADALDYWERRSKEGASKHTARLELRVLCQALRFCARKGLCKPTTQPSDLMPTELAQTKVYVPKERWLPRKPRDEYSLLLMQLSAERRDYVVTLCNTGMRLGELYRLEARHVDAPTKGDLDVPGRKTRRAQREVPMQDDALEVLRRRAKAHPKGPLFPEWGKLHRDIKAACKRAGIAPASPNDFRRTFASWLAIAGVPMLTTARLLGHASTKMVEQVYAQLDRGALYEGVAVLNEPKKVPAKKPGKGRR